MNIPVHCHTNLDDYKREDWPETFCVAPRVGDCVQSRDRQVLKIVQITHLMSRESRPSDERPGLSIELHKTV
jgi:hypothetical protein